MKKVAATLALVTTACALGLFQDTHEEDMPNQRSSDDDITESLELDEEHADDYEDAHAYAEDLDHLELSGSEFEKLMKEHGIDPSADDADELEEEWEEQHPEDLVDPMHPQDGVDVAPDTEDPDIIHLHADNFDHYLQEHQFVLVNFYAHKSDPEFELAALTIQAMGHHDILLAKVDTTAHSEFAQRFEIDHLPEKKFFVHAKEEQYTGPFEHQGMINWILKKTDKIAEHVKCHDLKQKTDEQKISLVYFGDKENALYKTFENAPGHPKMTFEYFTTDAECAPAHELHPPAIAIYRDFDTSPIEWKGEGDEGEATLIEWMNKEALPHFFELIDDYVETVFGQEESAVYLIYPNEEKLLYASHHTPFAEAADALKGRIYFITTGIHDEGIQQHLHEISGVEEHELPVVMIMTPNEYGVTKYRLEGAYHSLTQKKIEDFAHDFLENKLTPYHKGAPIPHENPNDPVVEVVRKTWHRHVMDHDKDVFVMFYDPEDPDCIETFPAWKELAEHVAGVHDLTIAQIDVTKNEIDRENIEHHPTLKLFPKGKQNEALHHELEEKPHKHLTAFKRWLHENSVAYAEAFADEYIPEAISDSDDSMFVEEL